MKEEAVFSDGRMEAYLTHLKITDDISPGLASLNRLVRAHQLTIPFSSFDIGSGRPTLSLGIDEVFHKVIQRKRGGYCFELNLLFKTLLASLGFNVRPICGRIIGNTGERRPILHRATLVYLEGETSVVDVGYGGPMASGALLLEDGVEQCLHGETYLLHRKDDSWWELKRTGDSKGVAQTELEFCTAAFEDVDFIPLHHYCSQPGARFYENNIANIRTPEGNVSLINDQLTLRNSGRVVTEHMVDAQAIQEAVSVHFGFIP